MYIVNGIAYAGEKAAPLKVVGVRPMDDLMLWVRFNTGEARLFDFKPLVDGPGFAPLSEPEVFRGVYIDYGVPVWNDAEIDISPEYIYENSSPVEIV